MKGCLLVVCIGFLVLLAFGLISAQLDRNREPVQKILVTKKTTAQSGGLGGIAPLGQNAQATVQAKAKIAAKSKVSTPEPAAVPPTATPIPIIVRVTATPVPSPTPTLTLAQIQDQAVDATYEDLMRTPEKYEGEFVHFTGEVIQTGIEDPWFAEPYGWLRIQIESEEYSSDAVVVFWNHDNRILTGDTVEVFGLGAGRMSYKTVLGSEMTVPQIDGRAVTVVSE